MSTSIKTNRHRMGMLGGVAALAVIAAAVTYTGVQAQTPAVDVFRIEEDWQLVIGVPDTNVDGPQVTCTISPLDMGTAYCGQFDINYHSQPDFSSGGLQIHTWDPLDPIEYANSSKTGVMATDDEVVTWTQTMTLDPNNGTIKFQVINGQSETWNNFGGQKMGNQGHLVLTANTALENLNGYSANVSLDNSGPSFGGNLIISQMLMAVRHYDANGNLVAQDTTPQAVHPR